MTPTLTSARASLSQLRSQYTAGVARRNLLIEQRDAKALEMDTHHHNIDTYTLTLHLLSEVSESLRAQFKVFIERTVTAALQAVFMDDSRFEVNLYKIGGKPAADWVVVNKSGERELHVNPESGDGGGLSDMVSMALRLALLELARPKLGGPLLLDEPGKHVSAEFLPGMAEFIKQYARRTGRQVIMITHEAPLAEIADKSYRVSKNAQGISEVAAI